MKNRRRTILRLNLAAVLILAAINSLASELKILTVSGTITSSTGRPLAGCLVSVVSESRRSAPTFTNSNGSFTLETSISPGSSTGSSNPVFLEIYWNRSLVFRQPLESLAIAQATPNDGASGQEMNWQSLLSAGGRVVLQAIKVGK
jgi:hypothetical protein